MTKMDYSHHLSSVQQKTAHVTAPRYRVKVYPPGPVVGLDTVDGVDTCDGLPEDLPYSKFDISFTVLTIICFYADVITDLVLAVSYLNRSRYLWGGLTLAFVGVPSVSNSILNLYFYFRDYKEEQGFKLKDPKFGSSSTLWTLRVVFTVLQMGPVVRNFESLRYGRKCLKATNKNERAYYYRWMLREDADACMLRLFECFMESAPQLTLQLYILVADPENASDPLRIISLFSSWISISWSLASYYRALRFTQESKLNMSVCAMISYFLWRLLEVGPRIVIVTVFITQYHYWIAVPLSLHWLFVFVWLQVQRLTFCDGALWQALFNVMCAFVSIFCFLNVKDGTSRYRCALFYAVFYVENVVLFALWFRFTDHMGSWYHLAAFFFVLCGAVLQAILFSCYYCCCHPDSGSLVVCKRYDSTEMFSSLCFPIPTPGGDDKAAGAPTTTTKGGPAVGGGNNGELKWQKQGHHHDDHRVAVVGGVSTPTISERSLAMVPPPHFGGYSLDGDVSTDPSFSTTKTNMDSISNTSSKKTETNV